MSAAQRSPLWLQPVLLGVGFALLVAISVTTALLVSRATLDSGRLAKTLVIQDKLSDVLLAVRRGESSQRGYLFTDSEAYLDDFRKAHPQAIELVEELHTLSKNHPNLQKALGTIDRLVDAKFSEMAETILLNKNGEREKARALMLSGKGRKTMADLRQTIIGAIRHEASLAAQHSDQTRNSSRILLYISLVGAALIVLIGAASVRLVQRNTRLTQAARSELEVTNANLERIVAHRTEDLTEANEDIQRFAYIVSHDLRSPLVNIMGFTTELEALLNEMFEHVKKLTAESQASNTDSPDTAKPEGTTEEVAIEQLGTDFQEALGFIKSSTANMDRLINAVLALSREGRREFHPEPIDLNELILSLVETVAHRTAELGATIDVNELPELHSDRVALQQIFSNLIDNALKYRQTDVPPHIEISGNTTATHAIFEVKDNGRGIDPRDHQRIFDLFRRAGQLDRPGDGLGLAHVRSLVRRLGGRIGVKSQLGAGSVFTITLPKHWRIDNKRAA